jgi:transposase
MTPPVTHGWIRKNSKKIIETTALRTRINIAGTINLKTMQVDAKNYKTINSESMIEYFNFLKTRYPKAPKIHVILGPYNKSKATTEYAETKNIKLHFLPAYSPNLNPIERLWKVLNEYIRNNVYFDCAKKFKNEVLKLF